MWKNKVEAECGDIACALVQNKVDLVDQAVVQPDEVEGVARKLGLKLYRTCVKENINVSEVFIYLAGLNNRKANNMEPPPEAPQHAPRPPAGRPDAGAGGGGGGSGRPPKELEQAEDLPPPRRNDEARTVELGPSKKRTKGKKKLMDRMTACSVA